MRVKLIKHKLEFYVKETIPQNKKILSVNFVFFLETSIICFFPDRLTRKRWNGILVKTLSENFKIAINNKI